jgi:serine/threonine-protein kinase
VVSVGDDFFGYVVDTVLGRGGYATVYRARRAVDPNSAVALKIIDDEDFRGHRSARLQREFEFAHQLDHPNIITVYELGDGWLAMELVNGGTATALTRKTDQLSALARIAAALDYTHHCGIVHCDVKPSNILVSQDLRRPVLTDFGVAYAVSETVGWHADNLEASLPYAAPELLRGRPPSALSDQYALSCTAVELLLGAPPFSGTTPMELIDAHLNHPVPSFSRETAWVPRNFDTVMSRALAKIPDGRYDSCSELIAQLTRALGG